MPSCTRSAPITTCSAGATACSSSPSAPAFTTTCWSTTRSACRCERSAGRRLVEDLVGRRRNDLDVFRDELPALDIFDELRLDLVGELLADARVLLDVRPFGDQEEALRVFGVAAEHAVLHLRLGLVHRIAFGVVELLERCDEVLL